MIGFDTRLFIEATITLFVIMDPPGNVPVFVRQAGGETSAYLALAAAILAVHLLLFGFLRFSGVVIRVVRENGITLLARIAGLLLAAIAVELVAGAVRGYAVGA